MEEATITKHYFGALAVTPLLPLPTPFVKLLPTSPTLENFALPLL